MPQIFFLSDKQCGKQLGLGYFMMHLFYGIVEPAWHCGAPLKLNRREGTQYYN
jgi:hypothetical protein